MAKDLKVPAAKAFTAVGRSNPLRKLDEDTKTYLVALLTLYESASRPGEHNPAMERIEKASKLMAEVESLASKLETEVFQGPNAELLYEFTSEFAGIPSQLMAFSNRLKGGLDLLGKPGQKSKIFTTMYLVQASELVRLKLGQHFDEHVAELFQSLGRNRSLAEDLSGDAIRKKRVYAKKHYPVLYADFLNRLVTGM